MHSNNIKINLDSHSKYIGCVTQTRHRNLHIVPKRHNKKSIYNEGNTLASHVHKTITICQKILVTCVAKNKKINTCSYHVVPTIKNLQDLNTLILVHGFPFLNHVCHPNTNLFCVGFFLCFCWCFQCRIQI